jgi:hypothetical protein
MRHGKRRNCTAASLSQGAGDDLVVRFSANRSLLPAYETVEKLRARAAADETVTNKQSRLRAMKALNDKDAEDAVALCEASDAGVDAVVALVGCPSVFPTEDAIVTEEQQAQNQLKTPGWELRALRGSRRGVPPHHAEADACAVCSASAHTVHVQLQGRARSRRV